MGAAVEPQLREAPVMSEGSCVGLDVHARSVAAGVIDMGSREVRSLRVSPGEATVAWLKTLPAPVRVVYEAGPTGYGLARLCAEAGIGCVVAAPSKIRPAADRVKTDRRDAERLARLLRLGEITPVRVPGPAEEAARDLVRAREDARGDLMRARHRLSKLLLRHGAVYDATGERPKVCVRGLAVLGESVLEVGVEGGEAFVPAGHGAFPVALVVSDREVDELTS